MKDSIKKIREDIEELKEKHFNDEWDEPSIGYRTIRKTAKPLPKFRWKRLWEVLVLK